MHVKSKKRLSFLMKNGVQAPRSELVFARNDAWLDYVLLLEQFLTIHSVPFLSMCPFQTFKEPLESMHDEELLTKSELTLIFGKIPPLLAVHENICHELVNLVSHWSEERPIGAVWLKAVGILALSIVEI